MMSNRPAAPGSDRLVVIYYGACKFCLRQVERMRRREPAERLEYVPRQTPGLDERFPQVASGDFDTGMRLVHRDGRVSVGADAVYHAARELKGWRRLAWLYRVPGLKTLMRGVYAWLARNRYRLAGRQCDEHCATATSASQPHPPPPTPPGDPR